MKLYFPKQVSLITDAKEDEHVMDLSDWQDLYDIMEMFDSFKELKARVAKRKLEEKINIEYEGLKNVWDEDRMPHGTLRETFNGVINVFGDEANDGHPPKKIAKDRLTALLADQFGTTVRSVKPKLKAVITAGFLKEEYGAVIFPTHMIR
ncbi:MAG: hypothetical protein M0R06_19650 [Sphaerochaeta sp.]|jgi:hypothetical protein|nr:hypothetical protein [Sphaerochaeta sp.]